MAKKAQICVPSYLALFHVMSLFGHEHSQPRPDLPEPEGEDGEVGEIGLLGSLWEDKKLLRRRVKEERSCMTRWLNDKAINVASVKAMVLNETALVCMAEWWCPRIPYPKAINIDSLRAEVGERNKFHFSHSTSYVWVKVLERG